MQIVEIVFKNPQFCEHYKVNDRKLSELQWPWEVLLTLCASKSWKHVVVVYKFIQALIFLFTPFRQCDKQWK
jgi:hypothetical protein